MIANPLRIQHIIAELEFGGMRIPEIQRRYVWSRSQIAKLLDSIYKGFPVGSLLLWDAADEVQLRDLDTRLGAGKRGDFNPKIVLDGQQRITSLGRVFDKTCQRQERTYFNVMSEVFEPYSSRVVSDPQWVDVTEILSGGVHEADVIDRLIAAGTIEKDNREHRNKIFDRLKRLSAIREAQFPVEIVREDDLEVVTEIFIRVNSAGTRLREAELALARLAWKLPGSVMGPFEKLEDECEERGFELDSRFLMRALIAVATRQSRFKDLKAFWQRPPAEIEGHWKRTANGVKLALDFVEGNVGIPGSNLLPSHISLIPLVLIFSERESLRGDEEKPLRRWFLLANAFSRYVGTTETTLNQDLAALGPKSESIEGLLDLTLRTLRGEPELKPEDLERAGTNSPYLPLAYLAVIKRNATDWFKGIKIRRDVFTDDQNIEYHHIFPKKLLDQRQVDRYSRDEMANIAFLGAKANRRIQATAPAKYLSEIAKSAPERLQAQFVPLDPALWELDKFGDFLSLRRGALAVAINDVLAG